jgi:hypothetical protein
VPQAWPESCSPCSLGVILILIHTVIPADPHDATWLTNATSRREVQVALALVPFCGIFFLWFMGAVRSQMGAAEDRFFATLFLGSGLIFVAMLFVLAAIFGGLISLAGLNGGTPPLSVWQLGRVTTYNLTNIYAMRMAAVFTIAASTIALRLRFHHRLIAWAGYLIALVLLFGSTAIPWVQLLFPLWVALVSANILIRVYHQSESASGEGRPPIDAD